MDIEGVVLAAGYSSRAGAFKMGLDIYGKTLIERCIEGMYYVCSRIIVIGGYQFEKVNEILKKYSKVEVIFNSRYADGMFTSVKEGMKQVRGEKFFLTPGDYPLISQDICKNLLAAEGDIIIPVFEGKKGHPILMRGHIAREILREPDASNLRDFINRSGYCLQEVKEEGILIDIDTQDDYKHILEKFRMNYKLSK